MNTILLVEDSIHAFDLVRLALLGIVQLEWAATIADAHQRLADRKFDLILLDIGLPDGDGYQLCSLLQSDPFYKHVPIIFLSSRSEPGDKIHAFAAGADDFVSKPFDQGELRARVQAKLRRFSLAAEPAQEPSIHPPSEGL